jgi:hypothetical protein
MDWMSFRTGYCGIYFGPNREEVAGGWRNLRKEEIRTKVFYIPTVAQESCFERILKFTLKQLLHVPF